MGIRLTNHLRGVRGFSLIELLVVIAILAILLGLLVPSLKMARLRASRTVCGTRLHSLGVAIQAHNQQRGDRFPQARAMPPPFLPDNPDPDPPLPVVLEPFVPADKGERSVYRCPGDAQLVFARCGTSYMYEAALSGNRTEDLWVALYAGITPAQVNVCGDFDNDAQMQVGSATIAVPFFHQQRNFLFADFHVGAAE
jgi:prepilin-type N-terminal cleavage/methylation domain-containing protein/prepilin-type processing-associated H-X9-DG protein